MQLLSIVVVFGCFVGAFCDAECFKKEAFKCNEELLKLVPSQDQEFSICNFQKKAARCVAESAVTCDMKFAPEAKAVQVVVEEMCEKGTKLHEVIEENRQCIMKSITDMSCLESIIAVVGDNPTPSKILEAQKEACRNMDAITSCTFGKVKVNCGADGLAAFKRLYEASTELQRLICKDIILPEKQDSSNSKLPVFYGPLEFMI
ncbi:hypothetical protein JTE90_004116 [Oedothorax gibbosus]|uniref:Uncharacterized protein n=1 Tax=Oedothorax gibbosus TaxID=931172 RepID=A0AAV6V3S7_9ARAC|nr:hypothetical protein JTE90_004116 [Oedothorax gibbosus]